MKLMILYIYRIHGYDKTCSSKYKLLLLVPHLVADFKDNVYIRLNNRFCLSVWYIEPLICCDYEVLVLFVSKPSFDLEEKTLSQHSKSTDTDICLVILTSFEKKVVFSLKLGLKKHLPNIFHQFWSMCFRIDILYLVNLEEMFVFVLVLVDSGLFCNMDIVPTSIRILSMGVCGDYKVKRIH